jgi:outer membrane receptor for ferrienterochelin and colicin
MAGQAAAQDAAATAGAAPAEGVIIYRPDYFAAQRPNTALDMVNRLPGFSLEEGDQVRGFAGAAGNVLIDGQRPTTKADSLGDILSRIPASQVERIELIRGGAPGIDMQGRSVVANVIRRKGDSLTQTAAVGAHVFAETGKVMPTWRYELSWRSGERSADLALTRGTSMDDSVWHGTRVRRDATGALLSREYVGNEGDGAPHSAKVGFKTPLGPGVLRANATYQISNFKYEEHFRSPLDRIDSIDRSRDDRLELGLNYAWNLTPTLSLEALGLQKTGNSEYRGTYRYTGGFDIFTSEAEIGETIGRVVLRNRFSDTLTVEGGGEAAFNFREGHVAYMSNGAPVTLPSADVRVEEKRAEGFIQGTWKPMDKLTVEGGVRVESSTISEDGSNQLERSFVYPKPRLLLTWSPNKQNQLRLRIEKEVGQLNFGDFVASSNLSAGYVVAGNPDLRPEQSLTVEGVYERRFWDRGALVLTLRHQQIDDVIDRVPVFVDADSNGVADDLDGDGFGDYFDAPGNIGSGTNTEASVNLTLPTDRLHIKGGELKVDYTWRDSEVTDPTTGESRRISGQRPQVTEVRFRQDLPKYKLNWSVGYYGGWEETHYRFNQVLHMDIWNFYFASVEYKPDPKTSVSLEASNFAPFTFSRERKVYTGPRDTSPLAFAEDLETRSQFRIYARVRRTF